jgi:dihydrofolate reductase
MRKVKLWIGMSFDGFTADADEKLEWLMPHAPSPDGHKIFTDLRRNADTVLVGRVNYGGFYQYWPKVQRDPKAPAHDVAISRWLDDVQKVVFSTTLREVTWKNSRLARGTVEEEVGALKRAPGGDILIQNSTRLTQSLLARDLVDEIHVVVAPVAVGQGRALFANVGKKVDLEIVSTKRFESGAMAYHLNVKR